MVAVVVNGRDGRPVRRVRSRFRVSDGSECRFIPKRPRLPCPRPTPPPPPTRAARVLASSPPLTLVVVVGGGGYPAQAEIAVQRLPCSRTEKISPFVVAYPRRRYLPLMIFH